MKRWLNIVLVLVFIVTGVLVWLGVRDRRTDVPLSASAREGISTVVLPTLKIQVETVPAQQSALAPVASDPATTAPVAPLGAAPLPPAPGSDTRATVAVAARDASPAGTKYVAQPGDTISKLAVDFFGSDSKANEDAILSSNPAMQQNPDRILAGQTYLIPTRFPEAADVVPSSQPSTPAATQRPAADDVHQLRYSARPGDTVSVMANALLGGNTNENRDTIINANPSLANDPDRVVVGKTYHIPVQSGQPLAAAASVTHEPATPPATQPDADQVVLAGSTRELRYTARAGDNVSTLAAALLGSDTKENRDAIVQSNPSLKQDPDRVLAGQTYWIPAPAALHP